MYEGLPTLIKLRGAYLVPGAVILSHVATPNTFLKGVIIIVVFIIIIIIVPILEIRKLRLIVVDCLHQSHRITKCWRWFQL